MNCMNCHFENKHEIVKLKWLQILFQSSLQLQANVNIQMQDQLYHLLISQSRTPSNHSAEYWKESALWLEWVCHMVKTASDETIST